MFLLALKFVARGFYTLLKASASSVLTPSYWSLPNTLVTLSWIFYLGSPLLTTSSQALASSIIVGGNLYSIYRNVGSFSDIPRIMITTPVWNLFTFFNDVYNLGYILYDVITFNGIRHVFQLLYVRYLL